jgi:thiamine pyrophosphate-dependent acetolactate synthase large subunit-like protein
MAQAYSRVLQKPGVCMAASGPGVINLTTGVANALIDCCPVVAIGGSSAIRQFGRQTFQEIDQLAIMKGVTKWADRVVSLKRIPEMVNTAFQKAMGGKPGPVYLDFPADILYDKIPEEQVDWSLSGRELLNPRPMGENARVDELIAALSKAKQPIILTGSGVIWSQAWTDLQAFVEKAGIPFYTTPQGRGVLPDDHPLSFLTMRSTAFHEADLILIIGTRMNYIIGHAAPPRFAANATIARIDIDADEIASSPRKVHIGIVGDCKAVLQQLLAAMPGRVKEIQYADWRKKLGEGEASKRKETGGGMAMNATPIHPLRLCEEVKNFMKRDAILIVDGQEILNYGRQSMPTFTPGHRLNSGPFGMMGVGMPFGVGAKIARPDKQVIVVHGDGSFGLNCMELDTAVRHKVPILVVISLNGGWTADPKREKVGRDLGYTRFDKMAESLGCYGEYVEKPEDIAPALQRAQKKVDQGMVALVNIKTDDKARAGTVAFSSHST